MCVIKLCQYKEMLWVSLVRKAVSELKQRQRSSGQTGAGVEINETKQVQYLPPTVEAAGCGPGGVQRG